MSNSCAAFESLFAGWQFTLDGYVREGAPVRDEEVLHSMFRAFSTLTPCGVLEHFQRFGDRWVVWYPKGHLIYQTQGDRVLLEFFCTQPYDRSPVESLLKQELGLTQVSIYWLKRQWP